MFALQNACASLHLSRSSSASSPYYFSITINTVYECVSISKTAHMGFAVESVLSVCINIDTMGDKELRVTEKINQLVCMIGKLVFVWPFYDTSGLLLYTK